MYDATKQVARNLSLASYNLESVARKLFPDAELRVRALTPEIVIGSGPRVADVALQSFHGRRE